MKKRRKGLLRQRGGGKSQPAEAGAEEACLHAVLPLEVMEHILLNFVAGGERKIWSSGGGGDVRKWKAREAAIALCRLVCQEWYDICTYGRGSPFLGVREQILEDSIYQKGDFTLTQEKAPFNTAAVFGTTKRFCVHSSQANRKSGGSADILTIFSDTGREGGNLKGDAVGVDMGSMGIDVSWMGIDVGMLVSLQRGRIVLTGAPILLESTRADHKGLNLFYWPAAQVVCYAVSGDCTHPIIFRDITADDSPIIKRCLPKSGTQPDTITCCTAAGAFYALCNHGAGRPTPCTLPFLDPQPTHPPFPPLPTHAPSLSCK